jgi:superfamily II DNA helicase RecQ
LGPSSASLFDQLKKWRLQTARRKKIPPFCILHDRVLGKIAQTEHLNGNDLLNISGVEPTILNNCGSEIIDICKLK